MAQNESKDGTTQRTMRHEYFIATQQGGRRRTINTYFSQETFRICLRRD
jgi:hypothetical protein